MLNRDPERDLGPGLLKEHAAVLVAKQRKGTQISDLGGPSKVL